MQSRRDFLQAGLLAGVTAVGGPTALPVSVLEQPDRRNNGGPVPPATITITLLQTTDVHCQLHAHDELFWENNQLTFRKAGGYAHLATAIHSIRRKNPANTLLIDTGDMFQGSMLSVKTEGKAFLPLLNALNYDLFLPGNWESFITRRPCRSCWAGCRPPRYARICTTTGARVRKGN